MTEHPPGDPDLPEQLLDQALAAAYASPPEAPAAGIRSVLGELDKTVSQMPRVHLREGEGGGESRLVKPHSNEMPQTTDGGQRYQMVGELARGGMGVVLRGRDCDLGRDLAVKVLLDSRKDEPEAIERFVEEAQITGQLQHPCIVPVYDLGQFRDRRPFFTMKLVKGKTLAGLLADRKTPTDSPIRYLVIFEQVCQALAYAHSRGVIHRDLKPSNIMVGAFGEVQVMDWGLAKVLPAGGVADEQRAAAKRDSTVVRTVRNDAVAGTAVGSQTIAGSVMGTPAYMAPEQARGEHEMTDQRADVFGLGAILCEVLTGEAPYTGRSSTELFRKAEKGALAEALERLDQCGADGELVDLAKRCLAADPWERPPHAGEVAERIGNYLSTLDVRLQTARSDLRAAEAAASMARRRLGLTLSLAPLMLIALLGLSYGSSLWKRDAPQIAQSEITDAMRQRTRQSQPGRVAQHANDRPSQLERVELELAAKDFRPAVEMAEPPVTESAGQLAPSPALRQVEAEGEDPRLGVALALRKEGLLEQSLRAIENLAEQNTSPQVVQELATAHRLVALENRLDRAGAGQVAATADEREALAEVCYFTKRYATAVQLVRNLGGADPLARGADPDASPAAPSRAVGGESIRPSDSPPDSTRLRLARYAALAGTEETRDDPPLSEARRSELRRLAVAQLAQHVAQLQARNETRTGIVVEQLKQLKSDPDFAGLRSPRTAKLPPEEQTACRELWRDVDQLLSRAESP